MAIDYTMTFVNNSANSWNFCCYQKDPGVLSQGALSAAWFVAPIVHPTTVIKFKWSIDYGLSWAKSGVISPGIIYNASQNWSVTYAENSVTLTKIGGSYTFENQRRQDPGFAFIIVQDGTVVRQDGVGIGISMQITGSSVGGTGLNTIYAQPAQPNVTTQFEVTPRYYVVFAQTIEPSEILDVTNLTNTVEVAYPPGVIDNVVTLDNQNQWHVGTTAAANAKLLAMRKKDENATFALAAEEAGVPIET